MPRRDLSWLFYRPADVPTAAVAPEQDDEQGDYSRGLSHYVPQMKQLWAAGRMLAGKAFDSRDMLDEGLADYKAASAEIAATSKSTDSLEGVQGVGDFADWVQYQAGQLTGNIAESLTAALTGALAGTAAAPGPGSVVGGAGGLVAKGLVKKTVFEQAEKLAQEYAQEQIAKGAAKEAAEAMGRAQAHRLISANAKKVAATVGAVGAQFGMNFGHELAEILPEAYEREGDDVNMTRVLGSTTAAAALDTVMEKLFADKAAKAWRGAGAAGPKPGLLSGTGKAALGGAAIEGGTEGLQTGLERYGKGDEVFSEDSFWEYADSIAAGALGGAAMGGGGKVLENYGARREILSDLDKSLDDLLAEPLALPAPQRGGAGALPNPVISPDNRLGHEPTFEPKMHDRPDVAKDAWARAQASATMAAAYADKIDDALGRADWRHPSVVEAILRADDADLTDQARMVRTWALHARRANAEIKSAQAFDAAWQDRKAYKRDNDDLHNPQQRGETPAVAPEAPLEGQYVGRQLPDGLPAPEGFPELEGPASARALPPGEGVIYAEQERPPVRVGDDPDRAWRVALDGEARANPAPAGLPASVPTRASDIRLADGPARTDAGFDADSAGLNAAYDALAARGQATGDLDRAVRVARRQLRGEVTADEIKRAHVAMANMRIPNMQAGVDPQIDSLATAVRKLGGLQRDQAEAEGFDPGDIVPANQQVVGKPLFSDRGKTADELGEALTELGYFTERPRADEIVDLLHDELDGRSRYSLHAQPLRDGDLDIPGAVKSLRASGLTVSLDDVSQALSRFTGMTKLPLTPKQKAIIESFRETWKQQRGYLGGMLLAPARAAKTRQADADNAARAARGGFELARYEADTLIADAERIEQELIASGALQLAEAESLADEVQALVTTLAERNTDALRALLSKWYRDHSDGRVFDELADVRAALDALEISHEQQTADTGHDTAQTDTARAEPDRHRDRFPSAEVRDGGGLFGDEDPQRQAVADRSRQKDEARNSGSKTARGPDLFSDDARQTDIADAPAAPAGDAYDRAGQFSLSLADGRTVTADYTPPSESLGRAANYAHIEFHGDALSESGYRSHFAPIEDRSVPITDALTTLANRFADQHSKDLKRRERERKAAEKDGAKPATKRASRPTDAFSDLDGKTIQIPVLVEETGEVSTLNVDAGAHLRELHARLDALKTLKTCVSG